MKNIIFIFLLYLSISTQKILKNGVYILTIDNFYLYYFKENLSLSHNFTSKNNFFRIKKISKLLNYNYYIIGQLSKNMNLYHSETINIGFNRSTNEFNFWKFIEINNSYYVIQNKKSCFIKIKQLNVFCYNITIREATKFKIEHIFSEVEIKTNSTTKELLKKEPIDVLIKYIDMRDPDLKRNGIFQKEKDYDNEELRYSVRSILKNLPWIRKIFILMPNEKVRYFKDYTFIKDKIIYVKDIDLLGHDSSNCNAFLFRYWKMKKFGISENIIIMDDDYFIGKKMKKSDFFYVKNGEVVPNIITYNFRKIDKQLTEEKCNYYLKKAKLNQKGQNSDVFVYSKYLTYNFILNIFNIQNNKSIYIPKFTHNAIPINLKEVKEIYDLIYFSKYRYNTLDCPYRIYGYILFQLFYLSYSFIKYNRKIKNIISKNILLNDSIYGNYSKYQLFCINKGDGNYSYLNYYKAKITMEYLFPIQSPYEIRKDSFLNISFNLSYSMDNIIKINEIKLLSIHEKQKSLYLDNELIIIIIIIILIIFKNINNSYFN